MALAKATATAAAAIISISILSFFLCNLSTSRKFRSKSKCRKGLVAAIGNTPLIRINSLSDATGCEILAKAEFLNPGGSVKDRVAVKIIEEACLVSFTSLFKCLQTRQLVTNRDDANNSGMLIMF